MSQLEAIAKALNGSVYPFEPSQEIQRVAKENGIVIVFSRSDNLMEFRGAIHHELRDFLSAHGGVVAYVARSGLVAHEVWPWPERSAGTYVGHSIIEAIWEGWDPCCSYKTDMPHTTFDVMEDGEVYCRGIVFYLADAEMP